MGINPKTLPEHVQRQIAQMGTAKSKAEIVAEATDHFRRKHKYGVAPASERFSTVFKRTFHSKGERIYAEHLDTLRRCGLIRNLELQ